MNHGEVTTLVTQLLQQQEERFNQKLEERLKQEQDKFKLLIDLQ